MKSIYMDNAASTEIRIEVKEALLHALDIYANPSSLHSKGQKSKFLLAKSRRAVAHLIAAKPEEIYFTASGTEANNWALRGVLSKLKSTKNHIITSKIEHPSILNVCEYLSKNGCEITYISVDENGILDIDELKAAIRAETALISIAYVNNEIGSVQNIADISALAKANGILMHTDAVQAISAIEINAEVLGVDLMTLSAHKIHGPKGVGALYIKDKTLIDAFILGGEQERNKRAGTENLSSIAAFGTACKILEDVRDEENIHCAKLKRILIDGLSDIKTAHLISSEELTSPHIASFYFDNIISSDLLTKLDLKGICVSAGSACSAGSLNPSHVMLSLGHTEKISRSLIRFSFSKFNSFDELDYVVETLKDITR